MIDLDTHYQCGRDWYEADSEVDSASFFSLCCTNLAVSLVAPKAFCTALSCLPLEYHEDGTISVLKSVCPLKSGPDLSLM